MPTICLPLLFMNFTFLVIKNSNKKRRREYSWLNSEILVEIKKEEVLWLRCRRSSNNAVLKSEFRTARNRVNALIRSARRRHYQDRFFKSRFNSRETWTLVNDFRGHNNTKGSHTIQLIENVCSDHLSIASAFNEYFAQFSCHRRSTSYGRPILNNPTLVSAFLPQMNKHNLRKLIHSFKNTSHQALMVFN